MKILAFFSLIGVTAAALPKIVRWALHQLGEFDPNPYEVEDE